MIARRRETGPFFIGVPGMFDNPLVRAPQANAAV